MSKVAGAQKAQLPEPMQRSASMRISTAPVYPKRTGSEVGDRKRSPWMWTSSASGSRRRSGSRSSTASTATRISMPGQVHPEAHVGAEAEGGVGLLLPVDVEVLGVVPAGLVVVGRADVGDDLGAGRDHRARHLGVDRRVAGGDQQGRLPADGLLDRLGHQLAVVPQGVELVGVGQQPEQEVAGGPVGRLGAGGEQQADEREDLLVARAARRRARRGRAR